MLLLSAPVFFFFHIQHVLISTHVFFFRFNPCPNKEGSITAAVVVVIVAFLCFLRNCPTRSKLYKTTIDGVKTYSFARERVYDFGKGLAIALLLGFVAFWVLKYYNLSGVEEMSAGFYFGLVAGILFFGLSKNRLVGALVLALLFPAFFFTHMMLPEHQSYSLSAEGTAAPHLSFVIRGDLQDEVVQVFVFLILNFFIFRIRKIFRIFFKTKSTESFRFSRFQLKKPHRSSRHCINFAEMF